MKAKIKAKTWKLEPISRSWDSDNQFPDYEVDKEFEYEVEASSVDEALLWLGERHPEQLIGCNVFLDKDNFSYGACMSYYGEKAKTESGRKEIISSMIKSLLESVGHSTMDKSEKRVWTEDEIKYYIQNNDKALYGALKKLYDCQTADEQCSDTTKEKNGIGFNAYDAEYLTSVSKFLIDRGYLSDKQKEIVRKKLVKYNKQLTRLANA